MEGKKKTRGRDKFQKNRKLLMFFACLLKTLPISFRKKMFIAQRYVKGVKGIAIRYILLKSIAKECGDNVSIHEGCFILCPENLSLGSNISIWPMSYIDATGNIEIENDVSIAHGATLLSTNHKFQNLGIPIKDQGIETGGLKIEHNVWIGSKATVLYGRTLHTGCIVAAGAVVTHDVPENDVVAGVPAKAIYNRSKFNMEQ